MEFRHPVTFGKMSEKPPQLTPFGNACSGALGALFANSLVFPLDVYVYSHSAYPVRIKTRMQVQLHKAHAEHYTDAIDAFVKILQNEGVKGLYSGLSAGLGGTVAQVFRTRQLIDRTLPTFTHTVGFEVLTQNGSRVIFLQ